MILAQYPPSSCFIMGKCAIAANSLFSQDTMINFGHFCIMRSHDLNPSICLDFFNVFLDCSGHCIDIKCGARMMCSGGGGDDAAAAETAIIIN